jgi:hypothetical protein
VLGTVLIHAFGLGCSWIQSKTQSPGGDPESTNQILVRTRFSSYVLANFLAGNNLFMSLCGFEWASCLMLFNEEQTKNGGAKEWLHLLPLLIDC